MPTQRSTGIHVEGLRQLQRTLGKMGDEIVENVRVGSTDLAEDFLRMVQAKASSAAESAAAATLRVYRDKVPKVGFPAGARASLSGNPRAGEVFFGTEFGGGARPTTRQFPSPSQGYFFFDVLRSKGRDLADAWFDMVADELQETWDKGARSAGTV